MDSSSNQEAQTLQPFQLEFLFEPIMNLVPINNFRVDLEELQFIQPDIMRIIEKRPNEPVYEDQIQRELQNMRIHQNTQTQHDRHSRHKRYIHQELPQKKKPEERRKQKSQTKNNKSKREKKEQKKSQKEISNQDYKNYEQERVSYNSFDQQQDFRTKKPFHYDEEEQSQEEKKYEEQQQDEQDQESEEGDFQENKLINNRSMQITELKKSQIRRQYLDQQLKEKFEIEMQSVPGRLKQAKRIYQHCEQSQNGNCIPLCVFGKTGLGKTSIIRKVAEFMENNTKHTKAVYINCSSTRNVNNVYYSLLDRIFHIKQKKKTSRVLSDYFQENRPSKHNKLTKIIILDEIDIYIKDQSFIYNVLEWIRQPRARVALFFISNIPDLSLHMNRSNRSRLQTKNFSFNPYNYEQILTIMKARYPNIQQKFESGAMTIIGKKICNREASDIRQLDKMYTQAIDEFGHKQGKIKANDVFYMVSCNPDTLQIIKKMKPLIYVIMKAKQARNKENIENEILAIMRSRSKIIGGVRSTDVYQQLAELKDFGYIEFNDKRYDCRFGGLKIHVRDSMPILDREVLLG